MMQYLDSKSVPMHLRGGYTGKKFKAQAADKYTVPSDAGLWSGGSRETYQYVRLADGALANAVNHNAAPWDNTRRYVEVEIKPGFALVRHSIFCGKDMGLTFIVNPTDIAALLPEPVSELSQHETIVLEYTCSRKSSYNGKDRYQMAQDDYAPSWKQKPDIPFPTRAEWESAKQSLIGKGLLNKAGAVTVAGRNARVAAEIDE